MAIENKTTDTFRIILAVLLLIILFAGSFWILKPFLPALIWATMIVIASWNLMLKTQGLFKGSRKLAVLLMSLGLLMLFVLPLTIALWTLFGSLGTVSEQVQSFFSHGLPSSPEWFKNIPLVGEKLADYWMQAASFSNEEIINKITPYFGKFFSWLFHQIGNMGQILVHFLLTVILSVILYAKGETAARAMLDFAKRLSREKGEKAMLLAAQSIRAVANGVIITAFIQTILTALGLIVLGIPYAVILSSITFLLCVIQIGVGPVLIGTIIWIFKYSDIGAFASWSFVVWSILIMVSDNFLRPFMIKRGANLPLLLIFAGVVGGLISFGLIGIFIGPVVLAVSFTLLQSWIYEEDNNPEIANAS